MFGDERDRKNNALLCKIKVGRELLTFKKNLEASRKKEEMESIKVKSCN
jgi:hypothetical protein